jgi:signal transduction histidine kinase
MQDDDNQKHLLSKVQDRQEGRLPSVESGQRSGSSLPTAIAGGGASTSGLSEKKTAKTKFPLHIVLIEDSEHHRIAIRRALTHAGFEFELVEYQRGDDALAALDGPIVRHLDAVVVAYDLPGINGLQLFRSLGQRHTADLPPFVMLSRADDGNAAVEALKAGMYYCVPKDTHCGYLDLIPAILEAAIRRHRQDNEFLENRRTLQTAHSRLDQGVVERTDEWRHAIEALKMEIKERKIAEKQLRISEQRLRRLSRCVLDLQENDRQVVAKELHDSIGASLAAVKFSLENRISKMTGPAPPEVVSLETLAAHLRQTIAETRRISAFQRPPLLDNLGLKAAITSFSNQMGKLYSDVQISHELEFDDTILETRLKIVLYRIVQEALSNVFKHSGAGTARIKIISRDRQLHLEIRDDGCGFDTRLVDQSNYKNYGLRSMRERTAICDGVFSVRSTPGRETVVAARFPLPESSPG